MFIGQETFWWLLRCLREGKRNSAAFKMLYIFQWKLFCEPEKHSIKNRCLLCCPWGLAWQDEARQCYCSFACCFFCCCSFFFSGHDTHWIPSLSRWFVLDAETRDLVSIHTDGNEQLSVMRYSVGRETCAFRIIVWLVSDKWDVCSLKLCLTTLQSLKKTELWKKTLH